MLKVCVVGAGAIGGFLGTRLAMGGQASVSALARGTTLVALRDHGWRLEEEGRLLTAPVALASDDPCELGPQDLLILTLKAPALPPLAPTLTPLISGDTLVLPAMNGVPWWFSDGIAALGASPCTAWDGG
jgi:2-dehydropantoate 2-reductase